MDLILPYIGKYLLRIEKKILPDINVLGELKTRRAGVANNYTLCSDDGFNTGRKERERESRAVQSRQGGWK